MKKAIIACVVVLVPVILLMYLFNGDQPEFTTSSAEAYELYEEGYAHILAFQFADAEKALTRAIELDNDFAAAHALIAVLTRETGRADESKLEMDLAQRLSDSLTNDLERAKVQLLLSNVNGSDAATVDSLLNYILAEQPQNIEALATRASQLYAMRDEAAKDAFLNILEIEPNYAPAYNVLGYLSASVGDYDKAVKYLNKYAFLAPDLANPHDSLGEVLSWAGRLDDAEKEFLISIQLDKDFYPSLINLGRLYMAEGRLKMGREILEGIYETEGLEFRRAYIDESLIRLYYLHDMIPETVAALKRFVETTPKGSSTPYYGAMYKMTNGDYDGAMAEFTAYIESLHESSEFQNPRAQQAIEFRYHNFRAITAAMVNDHASAAEEYKTMLEMNSDRPPHETWWIKWRLGRAYHQMGQHKKAVSLAFEVLDYTAERIGPLLLLAQAADALGKDEITISALAKLAPLLARADADLPAQAVFRTLSEKTAPPAK